MSLTQEQIEKIIFKLSKVSLNDEKKALKNMNKILDYMELLKEVNTENVIPTVSVIKKKNILRKDEVKNS
jgi:aspartyl-tRNA(Asn)/glutamyl-tRNA(Gln) amidotransferase subunit C